MALKRKRGPSGGRVLNLALPDLEFGRGCRQPFSSGSATWLDILFFETSIGIRASCVRPTRRNRGPESGWPAEGAAASGYRGANLFWFSGDRRGF